MKPIYWEMGANCLVCHGWGGDRKENGGIGKVCQYCSGKGKAAIPLNTLYDIRYWKLFA